VDADTARCHTSAIMTEGAMAARWYGPDRISRDFNAAPFDCA